MSTRLEMRNVIIDDLDLYEEDFVTSDDIDRLINIAIKKAESTIHQMSDTYFLSYQSIAITTASNKVDYPSDIYANKIKKIIFDDGNGAAYSVRKVRELDLATGTDINDPSPDSTLTWMPVNVTGEGKKIQLFPYSSAGGTLHIWYIRSALQLTTDSDVLDIDEFEDYIISVVKTKILFKDGDARSVDEKALEDELKEAMISTLRDMIVDDDDDRVLMDMSFYNDSVGC